MIDSHNRKSCSKASAWPSLHRLYTGQGWNWMKVTLYTSVWSSSFPPPFVAWVLRAKYTIKGLLDFVTTVKSHWYATHALTLQRKEEIWELEFALCILLFMHSRMHRLLPSLYPSLHPSHPHPATAYKPQTFNNQYTGEFYVFIFHTWFTAALHRHRVVFSEVCTPCLRYWVINKGIINF